MPRGLWILIPAVFIDLFQAGISFALLALGSVAGTAGGAVGGALAGQALCNNIGLSWASSACAWVGGLGGGAVGTLANPALAVVGVPLGIALGFVVSICLSMTFGLAFVLFPLIFMKMLYPRYLWSGFGEVVPGLSNAPFWSTLVIMSIIRKYGEEKGGVAGAVAKVGSKTAPGTFVGNLFTQTVGVRAHTQKAARAAGTFTQTQQGLEHLLDEKKYNTSRERIPTHETRTIMNDVRSRARGERAEPILNRNYGEATA